MILSYWVHDLQIQLISSGKSGSIEYLRFFLSPVSMTTECIYNQVSSEKHKQGFVGRKALLGIAIDWLNF